MTIELRDWYESFRKTVRRSEYAEPLRQAALARHLRQWTSTLTKAVVETCQTLGWTAAAKEQTSDILPVSRQEYLGLDVTAFENSGRETRGGWRLPVAVFELENKEDNSTVAYSLWKVCVVRSSLRGVFCYRYHNKDIRGLLQTLSDSVMSEQAIGDEKTPLLLVVGTRAKAEAFPDGFFQPYYWDTQWRKFCGLL